MNGNLPRKSLRKFDENWIITERLLRLRPFAKMTAIDLVIMIAIGSLSAAEVRRHHGIDRQMALTFASKQVRRLKNGLKTPLKLDLACVSFWCIGGHIHVGAVAINQLGNQTTCFWARGQTNVLMTEPGINT